jgi:hypothetical protein
LGSVEGRLEVRGVRTRLGARPGAVGSPRWRHGRSEVLGTEKGVPVPQRPGHPRPRRGRGRPRFRGAVSPPRSRAELVPRSLGRRTGPSRAAREEDCAGRSPSGIRGPAVAVCAPVPRETQQQVRTVATVHAAFRSPNSRRFLPSFSPSPLQPLPSTSHHCHFPNPFPRRVPGRLLLPPHLFPAQPSLSSVQSQGSGQLRDVVGTAGLSLPDRMLRSPHSEMRFE